MYLDGKHVSNMVVHSFDETFIRIKCTKQSKRSKSKGKPKYNRKASGEYYIFIRGTLPELIEFLIKVRKDLWDRF